MLAPLNFAANAVILAASVWALWTQKVPTRTFGSAILGFIAICAIINMDSPRACHSTPEVMMNMAFAGAALLAFWCIEGRALWKSIYGLS